MSFVLCINEIVDGPIKDLYLECGSSCCPAPEILPNLENMDFSGAHFGPTDLLDLTLDLSAL
ncbi:hypothetical protein CCICO_03540 [Corynebacterium ciconiae DSM 44920]|uniref:hypothetical protein n=1 Tax=Corynebacterium ciconiae TaxID=227319 RepID=UPI000375751C|nr:hypothetical protein [Corynebacterium ciconiae]WKD60747.1 hypothetical protein CCICO_03540 [Corynebacterium ciconiae DSM 44920]